MVARSPGELTRTRPTAVALGNFDGVHLGHRRILESLRVEASRLGLDPVALTFDPHPRAFLAPEKSTWLLTTLREKEERIRALGVEPLTLRFDSGMAGMEAGTFIRDILTGILRGRIFFLGPAHRFGRGASGDATLLEKMTGEKNCVHEIPPLQADGEVVSSSAIRHRLRSGDVAGATRMLGAPYALSGVVIKGEGRGRTLGFPTANLRLEDDRKAFPAFGVYGGTVLLDGHRIPAVGNIGLRPTFAGKTAPTIEIHLLGVSRDLYESEMTFELQQWLRPEKAFALESELREQIARDVAVWEKSASPVPG